MKLMKKHHITDKIFSSFSDELLCKLWSGLWMPFFVISLSHVHIFNLLFGNKQNYNIDVVFVYTGVEWVMSG